MSVGTSKSEIALQANKACSGGEHPSPNEPKGPVISWPKRQGERVDIAKKPRKERNPIVKRGLEWETTQNRRKESNDTKMWYRKCDLSVWPLVSPSLFHNGDVVAIFRSKGWSKEKKFVKGQLDPLEIEFLFIRLGMDWYSLSTVPENRLPCYVLPILCSVHRQ